MREILFRGKLVDSGEWIYGLLDDEDHGADFTAIIPHRKHRAEYADWEVDPTTVGQYTGLKDRNGERIFEGDVVRISKTLFAVEWRDAEYVFGHIAGQPWSYPYFASHAGSCEIIGNIHDNPELLGEVC